MKTDQLIRALINRLPKDGSWPVDQQLAWLSLMAMAFGTVYGGDAAGQLSGAKKPAAPAPIPFKPVEHQFYVDHNGFARKKGGQRIKPSEVEGTLHDMRGIDGDVTAIVWADNTVGIRELPASAIISAA